MRNFLLGVDVYFTVLTYSLLGRKGELCKRFTEKESACGRGGHKEKLFPVIHNL